jgi:DNA-binding transcriptional ArsR family regulator
VKPQVEVHKGPNADSRLARLGSSGRCNATNSKKYRAELKLLVSPSAKARDPRSQSEMFKALSAEVRLKMMYALIERELCECEVMVALDLTQSTASHHLSILERARLVTKAKRGKWAFYKATELGAREVLATRSPLPSVTPDRLEARIEEKPVT